MNSINEMAELLGENPGDEQTALTRVRIAASKSSNPNAVGPRTYGSKIFLDGKNVGLFEVIDGHDAEAHVRDNTTYLIFKIKPEYTPVVNAIPSYLLPKGTKVEVAISPKGTPQIIADDDLGAMEASGEVCVILKEGDGFATWYPTAEGEEPWEMTTLDVTEAHLRMAKLGVTYRVSDLESYLKGSFSVVRKADVFRQEA